MKKSNIKKVAVVGLCCTIISTSAVFALTDKVDVNKEIRIQINNEWVDAQNPFIENDRTMIPIDGIIEKFGLRIESDSVTNTVKIYNDDFTIILTIGNKTAKVIKALNGEMTEETYNLDVSPKIINNQTFIPIRFLAETLGAQVSWDNTLRAVIIDVASDITVERPIEFEVVDNQSILDNELLKKLYDNNHKIKGIYSLIDGDSIYVLVSAGEKPTGGYGLTVDSITEVTKGTAYIHATLTSPAEGSMVTQVLTYPNTLVKFNKGDIIDILWDLTDDVDESKIDEQEKIQIENLVKEFGENLKMVSLLAPEDIIKDSLKESYGEFVSTKLLEKWQNDSVNAPGRVSSSPWPECIDILSVEKLSDSEYKVNGNIIEMTSVEMTQGGIAASKPVTLKIQMIDGKWVIDDVVYGNYIDVNSSIYNNKEYGFYFTLPESWQGYSIVEDKWEGVSLIDSKENQSGSIIYIRHPEWAEENPRQDIPVMLFTQEQWKSLNNGDFSVGAAPIMPSKLGENSEYVFTLPARYNYEFLTGFEEVEDILENNPLQTFEVN
ncbi:stalk domain-containing protein [Sedimentibacter sp. MB31-C6]|uniref:stalk domain-containing protein n=1 Tax=Sedimentibacter sp. MB31-C6 TaxID=3109366 RepID=UPI002DDD70AE|nr:stalk domain-containing protein [Sedimentibacter sp. MB36-C1]WSI04583.1 stalk domain-containing protein [Sedimentibacter sp. MB36-C1]